MRRIDIPRLRIRVSEPTPAAIRREVARVIRSAGFQPAGSSRKGRQDTGAPEKER